MRPFLTAGLVVVLAAPAIALETVVGAPCRVSRPAEGVACFNPGVEGSPVTTCVIETDAGLVVVDTGLSPSMAEKTRSRIIREFGRDDFRWVINTHAHFDHTAGNQVFDDAVIIGHENVPAEMRSFYDGRVAWVERRRQRLDRRRKAASDLEPESGERRALEEDIRFEEELIEDLMEGYHPTQPTLTFSDRLNLTVGDLELALIWMGPAHTTSDILVHVPELEVLFTGDLFEAETLGVGFYTSNIDPERWIATLDSVLVDPVEVVVGGHGLIFTNQWIAAQRRYMAEVWRAVIDARASGASLGELETTPINLSLAAVADVLGVPAGDLAERHATILQEFWRAAESTPVGQAADAD